ncbi:MFS transporter [Neisseria perflava]|uniref:MFS transporter n=1 Tax=Neisseria perflava TaxID=33053 RepID=UPI00209F2F68|nr:MFS transporter [Neisseria perflava]
MYVAGLMLVCAILVALFVKDKPSDMGLPDVAELENRPPVSGQVKVLPALKSIFTNKYTWFISIVYIGIYTGYIVLLGTYGVSYIMQQYGLEKVVAANYLLAAGMGTTVSGLVIGYLSDKLKNRKTILLLLSWVTVALWLVFVYVKLTPVLLVALLFARGFTMSCFTLCWTVGNESNDRRYAGMVTGVVNCFGYLGTAIIPVVMGKIIDSYGGAAGYPSAFLVLIVIMAISAAAAFFIKETHGQNIYDK